MSNYNLVKVLSNHRAGWCQYHSSMGCSCPTHQDAIEFHKCASKGGWAGLTEKVEPGGIRGCARGSGPSAAAAEPPAPENLVTSGEGMQMAQSPSHSGAHGHRALDSSGRRVLQLNTSSFKGASNSGLHPTHSGNTCRPDNLSHIRENPVTWFPTPFFYHGDRKEDPRWTLEQQGPSDPGSTSSDNKDASDTTDKRGGGWKCADSQITTSSSSVKARQNRVL